MDRPARSVADLTTTCRLTFHQCLPHQCLQKNQWAENRLADFSLWVDGVGALAASRASLDSRFQSQPHELTLVKGTLVMLQDFLDQCVHYAEIGAPVAEATQNVDSALENLALLAVAIRRTGRRSRLEKADQKFDPADHSELGALMKILCLYRPGANTGRSAKGLPAGLSGWSTEERVLQLQSTALSSAQERLLQTNLRRRNRFLQAQSHSRGLRFLQRDERRNNHDGLERSTGGTETAIKDQRANTASQQPDPTTPSSFPVEPTISATSASIPQSKMNVQSTKRRSSQAAMTTVTTLTAVAQYPRPPKVDEGLTMFKCPCCCQTLPVEVSTEGMRWKKHLSGDISPYTCLLEDCPTPFATYDTEHDWENHVKNKHPPRRLCPFCQDMCSIFSSMEAFLEHIQVEHGEAVSESLLMAVMSHSGIVTIGVTSCPLCDSTGPESDPEFIRHVLTCIHDFSLRSLPWAGLPPNGPRHCGTYDLESVRYGNMSQWLETLETGETSRLQLSQWDSGHVLQEERQNDYFKDNSYFDLESVQDSLEALERSSRSFSQQEAEFGDTEETTSPVDLNVLPFPIPSYLLGSRYISRLEAAYSKMAFGPIGRADGEYPLPLPVRWNAEDKHAGLQVVDFEFGVQYTGQHNNSSHVAAAVRADNPMPPQCGIYYFEIELKTVPRAEMVAIGFSSRKVSLERLPGWELESWAYHSDDGMAFRGESQGQGHRYGPTFGQKDIVGCGVDFTTGSAFFTKNGVHLGFAFRNLPVHDVAFYPSVAVKRTAFVHIVANFGRDPYVFDIDGLVHAPRASHVYTVGWICNLPLELTAASLMLDAVHPILQPQPTDQNTYILGSIRHHNIVIICPEIDTYGTPSDMRLVADLLRTFPSIHYCVLVGLGGGVPSPKHDIRLGDIVVGIPAGDHAGVEQYEIGIKSLSRMGKHSPSPDLLLAVSTLRDEGIIGSSLGNIFSGHVTMSETVTRFARPSLGDRLYKAEYLHNYEQDTCLNCDESQLVRRPLRLDEPVIHYGLIASANAVLKDARVRDQLAENEILCVEMSAAGLMNAIPCLAIRGISDYADSHKNRDWQGYAAAVAAAYAKKLLSAVPPARSEKL